jgi:hypothetical protein
MEPIRSFDAPPGGRASVDSTPAEHEARKIRVALEQIDQFGDLRSFTGARHEKLALFTTVRERGLIAWKRTCGQYELTLAGRKWLMSHGGAPARRRYRSRLIGATAGVAVLAGAWFSVDASHRLFNSPSSIALATASPAAPRTPPVSVAARAEAGPVNAPADRSPPPIRADAAALPTTDLAPTTRSEDIADGAPAEPSMAPATRKAERSRRKASRTARQRRDDRGPAMVFVEPGRPPRRAGDPGWGGWNPGQNAWR